MDKNGILKEESSVLHITKIEVNVQYVLLFEFIFLLMDAVHNIVGCKYRKK